MKSPGSPSFRREVEREFWREIATGITSEEAAIAVGASQAAGSRWFRQRGGMPSIDLAPLSGRYLSFRERDEIAIARAKGVGVREVARRLSRDPSTISRELRRNAATRCGKLDYRASVAQCKAELLAQRPKTAKLVTNERLREYVQERLSGQVRRPDGTAVAGPATASWEGRNKPHRGDRKWVTAWSPEQIANRKTVFGLTATVTVMTPSREMPTSIRARATTRPVVVTGKRSPYPCLVTLVPARQRASPKVSMLACSSPDGPFAGRRAPRPNGCDAK